MQIENQLDAAILSIDGTGGKQGTISIGYTPCNKQGNTDEDALPVEFQVDDVMELVGKKDLFFKVNIDEASGLPKGLCFNTFVTYQFEFWPEVIYQTDEAAGLNQNPKFGYDKMHCIDYIDQ